MDKGVKVIASLLFIESVFNFGVFYYNHSCGNPIAWADLLIGTLLLILFSAMVRALSSKSQARRKRVTTAYMVMIILSTMYCTISILWMCTDFDSAMPPHNLPMTLLGPKDRVAWTEDRLYFKKVAILSTATYEFITLVGNYYFYTQLKQWSNYGKEGYNELKE